MSKRDVVVLSAVRSAIGSFGGGLADMEPAELADTPRKIELCDLDGRSSPQERLLALLGLSGIGRGRGRRGHQRRETCKCDQEATGGGQRPAPARRPSRH